MCSVLYLSSPNWVVFNPVFFRVCRVFFIIVLREIKADGRKLHSIFCLILQKNSELNNKMRLIGDLVFSLSLALSKKLAYFNHAANLLTYFNKLLKINK